MASKVSKSASKSFSALFLGMPNITDRTAKLSTQMEAKEIGVEQRRRCIGDAPYYPAAHAGAGYTFC